MDFSLFYRIISSSVPPAEPNKRKFQKFRDRRLVTDRRLRSLELVLNPRKRIVCVETINDESSADKSLSLIDDTDKSTYTLYNAVFIHSSLPPSEQEKQISVSL